MKKPDISNKKKIKKTKNKKHHHKSIKKTQKKIHKPFFPNNTQSYRPSINKQLVSLKTLPKLKLYDCNIKEAFNLKEPLKIGIPGFFYGTKCFNYDSPEAKKYLLSNLRANKHINIRQVIPPTQYLSNCWFNSMFVTFFISDKGRIFFHFLRQLMIEGKQQNGIIIPTELRNAFALLNFGIDSSIQGNRFAYIMDTNSIIKKIYLSIHKHFKGEYIVDIDIASNPLFYYMEIIKYLKNNSLNLLYVKEASHLWKDQLNKRVKLMKKLPHVVVLEFFEEDAVFNKKPLSFKLHEATYMIDSAVVRDISKRHFCAMVTINNQQIGYDGVSHHKLIHLLWKDKLNNDFNWGFPGTLEKTDGLPMNWNFTKSYQLLFYYRVE
jgi:hypothetical protein